MVRTGYFDGVAPRFLAHRGLSQHLDEVDENSLLAFQHALANGATHIESDVHATKDGVAVLFHDSDLKRVAGIPVKISELRFEELREIRLRHGSVVPSLAEGLEMNARLNLDIKSSHAVKPTVLEIEKYSAHDRVLVSSFSSKRRRAALKALSSPVATSASMREVFLAILSHKLGGLGFRSIVKDLDAFQLPVSQYGVRFASEAFIQRLKAHDVEVHFWTVNDQALASQLLLIGADGIVSDRVDLISER